MGSSKERRSGTGKVTAESARGKGGINLSGLFPELTQNMANGGRVTRPGIVSYFHENGVEIEHPIFGAHLRDPEGGPIIFERKGNAIQATTSVPGGETATLRFTPHGLSLDIKYQAGSDASRSAPRRRTKEGVRPSGERLRHEQQLLRDSGLDPLHPESFADQSLFSTIRALRILGGHTQESFSGPEAQFSRSTYGMVEAGNVPSREMLMKIVSRFGYRPEDPMTKVLEDKFEAMTRISPKNLEES